MSITVASRQLEGDWPLKKLDLSRLYQSCIFRSAARTPSHDPLSRTLENDHQVQWSPGVVDSALYGVETRRLKLMVLRYGPQVTVRPNPFVGFSLVQMPLRGSMVICSGSLTRRIDVGQAAIISSHEELLLHWSKDCEQVILRVPHSMLGEAARHPAFPGPGAGSMPRIQPLDEVATIDWAMLVQSLLDSVLPDQAGSRRATAHPAWIDQVEGSLALFTLLQMQQGISPEEGEGTLLLPDPQGGGGANSSLPHWSRSRMDKVRRYAMERLYAPVALEDMARAAGVHPRTLYTDCMRQYGIGPMVWLRALRLDEARRRIQERPGTNVTDIATECGFGHLGRFSVYYRERFGELPSETAFRSRG